MCVEYDERATDNRIKTGVQSILGGLVLASIPLVTAGIIGLWGVTNSLMVQVEYLETQTKLFSNFMRAGNRFTSKDGERLQKQIDIISQLVRQHNSEGYHREAGYRLNRIEDEIIEIKKREREDHK